MMYEQLDDRKLPELPCLNPSHQRIDPVEWTRERQDLLEPLTSNVYGLMPDPPLDLQASYQLADQPVFDGLGLHSRILLTVPTPAGPFSFPFDLLLPAGSQRVPLTVHIAFSPDIPDRYLPAEDILRRGFAIANLYYEDIVPDRPDGLSEGLAACYDAVNRGRNGCGAIGYWAWAASRILDWLQTHSRVNSARIAVAGHSRLGKTALWCAANDPRFSLVFSNDSGCSGAAITREKAGERIADITKTFPYWFCPAYSDYADKEADMPFDQHFLLASIAPRLLYVASAMDDEWADPVSELLGCAAASPVWERFGQAGLITDGSIPTKPVAWHEGSIGYHLRPGGHALKPEDWMQFLDFRQRHLI